MIFDIYGRYKVQVRREGAAWRAERIENGRRRPFKDLVIPAHLAEAEIARYLDDMLHEQAGPGTSIRWLE